MGTHPLKCRPRPKTWPNWETQFNPTHYHCILKLLTILFRGKADIRCKFFYLYNTIKLKIDCICKIKGQENSDWYIFLTWNTIYLFILSLHEWPPKHSPIKKKKYSFQDFVKKCFVLILLLPYWIFSKYLTLSPKSSTETDRLNDFLWFTETHISRLWKIYVRVWWETDLAITVKRQEESQKSFPGHLW